VRRELNLNDGTARLTHDEGADVLEVTGEHLISAFGPNWRLLIIGAGQMTQYLATMAVTLGYEVIICDPREEYAEGWEVPGTRLVRTMPDDTVLELACDAHTAVIALTHDPKLDDLALIEALRSQAFYVGAIGSRSNQEKRRARLLEFDVSPEQIERLHGPIGLKNGARTPPEIAVSILAQLTGVRYGYRIPDPILVVDNLKVEAGCVV
jgi:xanthine dehydrogenase accessory factor